MAKKSLGQNFLFDPAILKKIIAAAGITPDDTVVEIGPGHGRLTRMLAEAARKVIAIELDRDLYERLREGNKGVKNIEFILGDALEFPYEGLEQFKVVANVPYYITTPIIFRLIESKHNLKSMTLTVQKEVARRIAAKPGTKDFGVLSIAVQYYGKPELKFIIPKGAFRPVPKVDSAVIHIEISDKPRVKVRDEKLFFRVVRTAFSHRRKTLANALTSLETKGKGLKGILLDAGIEPGRRPETLSIQEFARLSDVITTLGQT